ncbi:hypothetical protein JTB14_026487 [Gonioctena quinquepunctata]|nr:hypothetical protein JTB14_026487 [Gonioctena quinquepunctata]
MLENYRSITSQIKDEYGDKDCGFVSSYTIERNVPSVTEKMGSESINISPGELNKDNNMLINETKMLEAEKSKRKGEINTQRAHKQKQADTKGPKPIHNLSMENISSEDMAEA